MSIRNIIRIDPDKCTGCGLCVTACAEGAIEIIDGKARLVSDIYCDGLGACLGECPEGAITMEKREADEFDREAAEAHLARQERKREHEPFACPGSMVRDLTVPEEGGSQMEGDVSSRLRHWPVQLKLVPDRAPFLDGADLLVTADCVPFAMGDFHQRILLGRSIVVGCPKLDDKAYYVDKLRSIIENNDLRSLAVVHMEVPCCGGLAGIVRKAVELSGKKLRFDDVTVSIGGEVLSQKVVPAE